MFNIEAFEEIDAPPDAVWEVLLEFDTYPEWNPFVRSITGLPVEGERLEVTIQPPASRSMTFTPDVIAVEPNRRLAWRGRLFVPFVFDGYHEFHLEPVGDDNRRTRFLQRETFRGALVPILLDEDKIMRGFEAMNRAIKERAERRLSVER
ncbi:SRPBCC domain-containing protein [Halostagnicola sp. A-GB9-2]|uniref:SRPBCC domain-containing protein n=1 Tax=Halostagnicola sp. A-GB9-2 TaxID=3048066 RepID=UPI0024C0B597|nr:SRPBCC domain-containing protein [Halostagnicola sp. A-GB9-2]MDJ1431787.1 SRPBCC domain-containing protein [Halostagnicola sp. A-GB9-2]